LVFSYGTRDIYICPTLSEEDAKQLLLAIHQRFPIYEMSNTDEYAQRAAEGDLA
jgi:hypothetical protein